MPRCIVGITDATHGGARYGRNLMAAVQPNPTRAPFHVGDEIRKARMDARMEQAELARQVGVSRPLVSKWERNKSEPTISQFRAIARVTNARWLLQQALKLKLLPGAGLAELDLEDSRPTLDIVR